MKFVLLFLFVSLAISAPVPSAHDDTLGLRDAVIPSNSMEAAAVDLQNLNWTVDGHNQGWTVDGNNLAWTVDGNNSGWVVKGAAVDDTMLASEAA
ncbi:hypothetical protein C8J57DRAFT_1715180 [Mycena rebaudengoi]|nr:hypothetical protein C8J57DRAFT_1715180 [Mycena rebaudengoi]